MMRTICFIYSLIKIMKRRAFRKDTLLSVLFTLDMKFFFILQHINLSTFHMLHIPTNYWKKTNLLSRIKKKMYLQTLAKHIL